MLYLLALGSNRRHHRHGDPRQVVQAALAQIARAGARVVAASPVIASAPVGPSRRRYANGAAMIETALGPPGLLALLKRIERDFGRTRGGQAWSARVLDLDIVLWEGGPWASPGLIVPHPRFRERTFVLGPAAAIAPRWRDPLSGLSLVQLRSRLTRPRPARKRPARSGP